MSWCVNISSCQDRHQFAPAATSTRKPLLAVRPESQLRRDLLGRRLTPSHSTTPLMSNRLGQQLFNQKFTWKPWMYLDAGLFFMEHLGSLQPQSQRSCAEPSFGSPRAEKVKALRRTLTAPARSGRVSSAAVWKWGGPSIWQRSCWFYESVDFWVSNFQTNQYEAFFSRVSGEEIEYQVDVLSHWIVGQ